eukprot:CAMPEP_0184647524 /NCGR_PEP_ID=MMETSP0308-20130426/4476_1 /TAXON_ID=38269 /ORGANISM="Gloeochaete witrockiana, Strain SAG 46.84" /LENGTH=361 /DNA_ID=CAMNT_0027078561 /DNA_START=259 /DNA_END=1344 /DNA_ORIENTATION=+
MTELRGQVDRMQKEVKAANSQLAGVKCPTVFSQVAHPPRDLWMLIAIPTVPRMDNPVYLLRTLQTLTALLTEDEHGIFYGRIKIVVINNRVGMHAVFDLARHKFRNSSYITFVEKPFETEDPFPDAGDLDMANANLPGTRVRKQTADVAYLLRASLWAAVGRFAEYDPKTKPPPPSVPQLFMFMEDDFELCPNGWHAISYAITKATLYHPDWVSLRFSSGLNGLVIRGKDVVAVASYFEKNAKRRPPDHLMAEWYMAETDDSKAVVGNRMNMAFRFNLFHHIGQVSSLGNHPPSFGCYSTLNDNLFEGEMFHLSQCPDDDVWPCQWTQAPYTPTGSAGRQIPGAPILPEGYKPSVVQWTGT